MIFNQASGVIDNNAIDEVAVQTFNQKFTQYEGSKVKGATVNALLQKIVSNNLANPDDPSKQVSVSVPGRDADWKKGTTSGVIPNATSISVTGKALAGKAYNVETGKDPQSGYINIVYITAASY